MQSAGHAGFICFELQISFQLLFHFVNLRFKIVLNCFVYFSDLTVKRLSICFILLLKLNIILGLQRRQPLCKLLRNRNLNLRDILNRISIISFYAATQLFENLVHFLIQLLDQRQIIQFITAGLPCGAYSLIEIINMLQLCLRHDVGVHVGGGAMGGGEELLLGVDLLALVEDVAQVGGVHLNVVGVVFVDRGDGAQADVEDAGVAGFALAQDWGAAALDVVVLVDAIRYLLGFCAGFLKVLGIHPACAGQMRGIGDIDAERTPGRFTQLRKRLILHVGGLITNQIANLFILLQSFKRFGFHHFRNQFIELV